MTSKIKWISKRIEVEGEDHFNYDDLHFPRGRIKLSHYEIEFFPTCGNCEANMQIDYKFCPYCGVELEWTDKPQKTTVEVIDDSPWKEEEKKRKEEFKFLMEELDKIGENERGLEDRTQVKTD